MAPILSTSARKRSGAPTDFRAYVSGLGVRVQPAKAMPTTPTAKVKRAPKATAVKRPTKPKKPGVVDSCGNRVVPLTDAQRVLSNLVKPAHTLDISVSGLGGYRSYRSHPNKSFPATTAVTSVDSQGKAWSLHTFDAGTVKDAVLTEL